MKTLSEPVSVKPEGLKEPQRREMFYVSLPAARQAEGKSRYYCSRCHSGQSHRRREKESIMKLPPRASKSDGNRAASASPLHPPLSPTACAAEHAAGGEIAFSAASLSGKFNLFIIETHPSLPTPPPPSQRTSLSPPFLLAPGSIGSAWHLLNA